MPDAAGRSAFQGDIYADVPFTKVGAGDTVDRDPKWSAKRRHVAPILYPCDMYGADGVTLTRSQAIVGVYEARGIAIPDDWDGAYSVCPLPDLTGDGSLWVADFRLVSSVDRSYLTSDRRVRALSETGWGVFRQRLVTAVTRAAVPLDDVIFVGKATWEETSMETVWVASGREPLKFQAWLDTEDERLAYGTPRENLEARDIDPAWDALHRELG